MSSSFAVASEPDKVSGRKGKNTTLVRPARRLFIEGCGWWWREKRIQPTREGKRKERETKRPVGFSHLDSLTVPAYIARERVRARTREPVMNKCGEQIWTAKPIIGSARLRKVRVGRYCTDNIVCLPGRRADGFAWIPSSPAADLGLSFLEMQGARQASDRRPPLQHQRPLNNGDRCTLELHDGAARSRLTGLSLASGRIRSAVPGEPLLLLQHTWRESTNV